MDTVGDREKAGPLQRFIGYTLCFVFGLGFMYLGHSSIHKAKASLQWPSITGLVIESKVVSKRDRDGDDIYRPGVVFEYVVDGTKYSGTEVTAGKITQTSGTPWRARKKIEKYPRGSNPLVYYNPVAPEDSVLEPGVVSIGARVFFWSGFFFFFFFTFGVLGLGEQLWKLLLFGVSWVRKE